MNLRRLRKQITYAALFWGVVILLIAGPIVLFRAAPRGSRQPTPLPTVAASPINVQSVEVIQHAGSVDVVVRLNNPNARAGIVHYPVTFILFDTNNAEITRVAVSSHILPGSLQYISALNIAVSQPVAKVTLKTPDNPVMINLSSTVTLPSFSTALLDRITLQRGGEPLMQQKGIVTNNSTFDWQYVEVTAVALDANDQAVGIGKTFVGRLRSGEQREFTIEWPTPVTATARVVTLATTNIFKEDNIIRTVGDPSLLR
jgi:hypothetical protein